MALTAIENGAYDSLDGAPSPATSGTTLTVHNSALWPDPATVGPYSISLWPSAVAYDNSVGERAMVTGKSGAVLTIVRAVEGSTARSVAIGWQIAKGWGAQDGRGALSVGERNLLRNPGFWLWQRGTSISPTDGQFAADGWYSLSQTAAITGARVNPTNAPAKSPYGGSWTQVQVAAQRHGVAQIIPYERTYGLRGEPVRFEIMLSASPFTGNLRFAILEWTGTADAPTKDVVNSWTSTNYTAGNFFISTTTNVLATGLLTPSATPALASLRATVGSSANNLIVFVWTESAQAQSNLFVTSDAWFVPDTLSAPYTPRGAAAELAHCQRYYEKSYNIDTAPGAVSSNVGISATNAADLAAAAMSILLNIPFQVRKRANPTITLYDFAGNSAKISELSTNASVVTSNVTPSTGTIHQSERGFSVLHDAAGVVGGLFVHWTADAEIGV